MTGRLPNAVRSAARLFILCALLDGSPALADQSSWNTNSDGRFDVAANWDNGVPDGDDLAYFGRGNGVSYTVTFVGTRTGSPRQYVTDRLTVGFNTVSFVRDLNAV